MTIETVFPEAFPGRAGSGALSLIEASEGDREFLEALAMRLDEIVVKPKGRFVISYRTGQPGARRPPTIR
jgi:hypothetical protein